jgi:hypothetical protein
MGRGPSFKTGCRESRDCGGAGEVHLYVEVKAVDFVD